VARTCRHPNRKQDETVTRQEIDQGAVEWTRHAMSQGHRITPCEQCGGPKVHSKREPYSLCVRCGLRVRGMARPARKHRCIGCWRLFLSVIAWKHCERCRQAKAA
jgi:hypothetical protein